MTFYWPHAFWLLLIPLALFLRDRRRRASSITTRPKITQAEANQSSVVIRSSPARVGVTRTRLFLYLGLVAATAALARPQWGRLEEPVFDQAREIIIALDLSRSMLAQDVKPSRLERARLLITSLLERLKGERVGLIVFSGTAFLQSPLSADYEILREFLPVLDPGYLPEGGTDYEALLDATTSAFGASGAADRFLVVLSDGESQTDTWRRHVDALKKKGIRVLGLGIGTGEGAMIPDGSGAFVKDERGAVVLSKLNSATLRELADKTDGVYTDASGWLDLSQLVQSTVEQGRRGEFTETNRVRLAERFQWPLAAALVLLLLSFWREFPVRPKPRPIQLTAAPTKAAALALFLVLLIAPASTSLAADAPGSAQLSAPLTQLVGRLATRDQPSAQDYAELARTTLVFGERTQASHETVPEGALRDALAAVAAGQSLDPKAADWPALRDQLEALLPQKKPPQPEKPKPDQKKPEQNKKDPSDQKGENGEKGEKGEEGDPAKNDLKDEPKSGQSQPEDAAKPGNDAKSPQSSPHKPAEPQKKPESPGQSAFGDMTDPPPPEKKDGPSAEPGNAEPPAPPPGDMQQVGGAPSAPSNDPARLDPSLSIPLQKLDQVKQGDSPAQLFQLLQGPATQPATKGKDW